MKYIVNNNVREDMINCLRVYGQVFTHDTFNLILITVQWGKVLLDQNYRWGKKESEVRGNRQHHKAGLNHSWTPAYTMI